MTFFSILSGGGGGGGGNEGYWASILYFFAVSVEINGERYILTKKLSVYFFKVFTFQSAHNVSAFSAFTFIFKMG
jgi:hypothetical protein